MIEVAALLKDQVRYKNNVPVLNRDDIETISVEILRQCMPKALEVPCPVNIEYIIENYFGLMLDFKSFTPDSSILGETIFSDGYREVYDLDETRGTFQKQCISVKKGTIILDSAMAEKMENRTMFTEAHELGHWILHALFYGANEKRACRSFRKQSLHFHHRKEMTPIEWTEWQANTFASTILSPRQALRITLRTFLEDNGMHWSELKDFSEYENRIKYDELLSIVASTYKVSRETALLRMNKLCKVNYPVINISQGWKKAM